jgi:NAD(P)H dehydrogenase (quinone)
MTTVLISYYSRTGHTKKMAKLIEKGIKESGCEVILKEAQNTTPDDMLNADAVVLGSPTYYGTMAAPLKKLLDDSVAHHGKLAGKVGGAFASSGMIGGGNETTLMSILQALLIHGMIVHGEAKIAHFGPVSIGAPDDTASSECVTYGKRIGELTKKLSK